MKNELTLKTVAENAVVLQRNGHDMVCPMFPPLTIRQKVHHPLYGVQEQVQIQKSPCNSGCPLFDFHYFNDENIQVSINCGASLVIYKVSQIIPMETSESISTSIKESESGKIVNLSNSNT